MQAVEPDISRPFPANGKIVVKHGGRTAEALVELPAPSTRDGAGELPGVVWLTVGLLAAHNFALQVCSPYCLSATCYIIACSLLFTIMGLIIYSAAGLLLSLLFCQPFRGIPVWLSCCRIFRLIRCICCICFFSRTQRLCMLLLHFTHDHRLSAAPLGQEREQGYFTACMLSKSRSVLLCGVYIPEGFHGLAAVEAEKS